MAVDYGSLVLSIVIRIIVSIVGRGHVTDGVAPGLLY